MEDGKQSEEAAVPMDLDVPPKAAPEDMEVVMEEEDYEADADEDGITPVKRLEAAFGAAKEDAPCLQVVVRVRPIPKEREQCTEVVSQAVVRTTVPDNSVSYKLVGPQVKEYTFNRVFSPESTQEEIYKGTTEPLVDALYMGKSGLLFAYGVTNAGKTFTIMGSEEQPGLLPRALSDIFVRLRRDEKTTLLSCRQCSVVASYLEVYNDQIFDLLDESSNRKALKPADRGGRIEVKGLSKHEIQDVQAGLNLVRQGAQNRQKAATRLNIDSSRSHSVFTIELVTRPLSSSSSSAASSVSDDASVSSNGGGSGRPADTVGTLWIVDLAGSERSGRTGHSSGKLQREASGINTSLMKLWRCLDQLRKNQSAGSGDGQQLLVPFRECKITHLFMNHLTGVSVGKTVMILNVNPSKEDYDETAHVLNQGSGAQEIRVIKDFKREMRHRQLLGGTHDYDGRRILKRRKSLEKRAAQPAATGGGGGGKGAGGGGAEEDEDEEELSGVESDTALTTTGRKSIAVRHWRDVEQDNLRMKDVEEENRVLRQTVESLKNKLCQAETQIREEVAEEMAQRMSVLEQQVRAYRESSLLLSVSSSSSSGPSAATGGSQRRVGAVAEEEEEGAGEKEEEGAGGRESCSSARKIYQGRLEKRLKEMEDQRQEAEEEQARMRARHEEEVGRLRARIQELMEREEDRDSMDAVPGLSLASLQEELEETKRELDEARAEADAWKARALSGSGAAAPSTAPGETAGGGGGGKPTGPRSRKRSKSSEAATTTTAAAEPPAVTVAADPASLLPPPTFSQAVGTIEQQPMPCPPTAASMPPPPPATTSSSSSSSSKANDDRRSKIQERIRQQIRPKLGGSQQQQQEEAAGSGSTDSAAAAGGPSRTPIALRLRSRQAAPQDQQQQGPPIL